MRMYIVSYHFNSWLVLRLPNAASLLAAASFVLAGVSATAATAAEFAYPAGEAGTLLRQKLTAASARALPPLAPPSAPRAARSERGAPIPQIGLPTVELPQAQSHLLPIEQRGVAVLRPLEDQPALAAQPNLRPARPQLPVSPLVTAAGADPAAPPKLAAQGIARLFGADPLDDATAEPMLQWLLTPLGPVRTTPAALATESIPDPRDPQRALPRRPTLAEIDPTPASNQPLPTRVLP